jgi:ATP-dependent RNA helicase HrpB
VHGDFLVAVEIEDRKDQKLPVVRRAVTIEPAWLLDLFPERVTEKAEVEWNRTAERVEHRSALMYQNLVIEESRGAPDPAAAAALLAGKALEAGLERFTDLDDVESFRARAQFAAAHTNLPPPDEEQMRRAIERLAQGLRSFADLKGAMQAGGLVRALERELPPGALDILAKTAPARVALPRGRQVKVHYEPGQPPWIESRLQDFFGMRETPRIAGGKVPLVVRLLAPNHRPVQMTTDLAGFWERLYPQVRRELMRRYPKHAWPESGG